MALTFINQVCSLCGKKLENIDQIFSFPSFIQNTKDEFYKFNDSSFHVECVQKDSLGNKAIRFAEQFILETRPETRRCIVGENLIQKFDDYIFIDLLTSNEKEDLYKFNFITLDRNNLKKWKDGATFTAVATKFVDEGKWGDFSTYKYLDNLINEVRVGEASSRH